MKRFCVLASSVLLLLLFNAYRSLADDSDTIWTKSFVGSGYVVNALFSPDDKSIFVTTTEKFYEVETTTSKILREIPEIRGAKYFSKDGRYAYSYDLKKVDMITKETKGSFVNPFFDSLNIFLQREREKKIKKITLIEIFSVIYN